MSDRGLPDRIIVDANGAYWRDYAGSLSALGGWHREMGAEVVAVYVPAAAQEARIAALTEALTWLPCPRADFPNDTCDFWAETYGQERCLRCAALLAQPEGGTHE